MQHVRIRITAHGREGDIHPMYGLLTREKPVERATALQWTYTGDSLGMLHYVEGDPAGFADAVDDIAAVFDAELVHVDADAFYAYVRAETTPGTDAMWAPVTSRALIIVPPIRYHEDGTVTLSLFGPDADHRQVLEAVPDAVDVTVEGVGDLASLVSAASRLSDRQREAVTTALELDYYRTPRGATQADVAAAMDCAPSTAAEHLQKAEATLVRSALER